MLPVKPGGVGGRSWLLHRTGAGKMTLMLMRFPGFLAHTTAILTLLPSFPMHCSKASRERSDQPGGNLEGAEMHHCVGGGGGKCFPTASVWGK